LAYSGASSSLATRLLLFSFLFVLLFGVAVPTRPVVREAETALHLAMPLPAKLAPSPRDVAGSGVGHNRMSSSSSLSRHGPHHRNNGVAANAAGAAVVSDDASATSGYSALSVSSSYRHHSTGPFMPPQHNNSSHRSLGGGGVDDAQQLHAQPPSSSAAAVFSDANVDEPKPVLVRDSAHQPKTTGSFGLLVVGLGGANGTTLLAGILANRRNIEWRGPRGEPMSPNYYGCITQLDQRGAHGGVGFRDKVKGLADASMCAVGGWDIRPTKLGDALLEARVLDYDLVRQVKDEMNQVKVFRGVYDSRFIGSSQHKTATHILSDDEAATDSEALKCLRADIRYFRWRNGLVGHTTVVWSASVEPNCDLLESLRTADELLDAIEQSEEERGGPLPPSLLYATAALLEGAVHL